MCVEVDDRRCVQIVLGMALISEQAQDSNKDTVSAAVVLDAFRCRLFDGWF